MPRLFQQHKGWLYTWTSSDGQYRNQIDYVFSRWIWRSSIQSTKTRLGADCISDHELLIAKFRLKLKKERKTTKPFRYDLNQISDGYTSGQHPLDHGKESSRKTSISALLTMPKPLTLWITINCGKFWKKWEYQTTWSASWEAYMQVRKQQLELDMEQQTCSK